MTPTNSPIAAKPPGTAEPPPPLRVLIAEDQEVNRLLIATLVERAGHRPCLVRNGLEALEAARDGEVDLILMDLHMPEMDGIAATRAIRAKGGCWRTIPIIAFTADTLNYDLERLRAEGFDDLLAKPLAVAELRAILARGCHLAASAPLLDRAVFDRLQADVGAAAGRRVVDGFLDDAAARIAAAAAASSPVQASEELASVRTNAAALGAMALAALCGRLSGTVPGPEERRQLEHVLDCTRDAIAAAIG
ncbi:MAG TPA: response regulator [Azospirillaceae bacterium]|nr:response regulator [Azospirillaceae bacterium]